MDTRSTLTKAAPLALMVGIGSLVYIFRYPLVDDAYITFRYSENLRLHGVLRYNIDEPVLGTTSPLWAVLLAFFRTLGIPYEFSSVVLGINGFIAAFLLSLRFMRQESPLGAYTYLLLAGMMFFPLIHITATSGMESGLYVVTVVGALRANLQRSAVWAGILSAAACGLRPDGAILFVVLVLLHAFHEPRYLCRVLAIASVPILPWLLWASYEYGSFVPHSVAAKRIFHPSTVSESVMALQGYIFNSDLEITLCLLAFGGVLYQLFRLRNYQLVGPTVWIGLYIAGLGLSGVAPTFFWYLSPWWLFVWSIGIGSFLSSYRLLFPAPLHRWAIVSGVSIAALILGVSQRAQILSQHGRMEPYRAAAGEVRSKASPGNTIFLCEVGIMGFELFNHRILDGAGLVSPQLLSGVPATFSSNGDLSRYYAQLYREQRPNWIVSCADMCGVSSISTTSDLNSLYVEENRLSDDRGTHQRCADVVIYRRVPELSGPVLPGYSVADG